MKNVSIATDGDNNNQSSHQKMSASIFLELKKDFKCDQCNAEFVYQNSYELHAQEPLDAIRPFKCDECPEAFLYEGGLKHHSEWHWCQRKSNMEVYENATRGRNRTLTAMSGA